MSVRHKAGSLLSFRLSGEQWKRIEKIGEAAGQTPSEWAKDLVLGAIAGEFAKIQIGLFKMPPEVEQIAQAVGERAAHAVMSGEAELPIPKSPAEVAREERIKASWHSQYAVLEKASAAERAEMFTKLSRGRPLPAEWKAMEREVRIRWLDLNWPLEVTQ